MKKYLLASALVVGFAGSAYAVTGPIRRRV